MQNFIQVCLRNSAEVCNNKTKHPYTRLYSINPESYRVRCSRNMYLFGLL